MGVKDTGIAAQARKAEETAASTDPVEAVHLVGSGLVTGVVALVLTAIAIPVSLGMGLAWGARALASRVRGG